VIAVRVLVGLAGAWLVLFTVFSAIRSIVLPRATRVFITRALFITTRRLFDAVAHERRTYEQRDRVLALYAPFTLLLLPFVWVTLTIFGFTAIFWAAGVRPLSTAFLESGSSMLTLGFERPKGVGHGVIAFIEAGLGFGLLALLISYLPSMYAAFSRREAAVAMLETRAGNPPTPTKLLTRYARIDWLDSIDEELFPVWEQWFVDVEESHTSLPALASFRSPLPGRSWIIAGGCVLDTAALVASTLDRPRSPRAEITVRSGYLCLRRIADVFGLPYDPDPAPTDPISVSRQEWEELCAELEAEGIPLKADRDEAWRSFSGWRVNYDTVLVGISKLVVAPEARWSSDRPGDRHKPTVIRRRRPR
jgi:hypothetical protein